MDDYRRDAEHFLTHETQFHLGMMPTEQSHPHTRGLAETLQQDCAAGVRLLQAVDQDVAALARAHGAYLRAGLKERNDEIEMQKKVPGWRFAPTRW